MAAAGTPEPSPPAREEGRERKGSTQVVEFVLGAELFAIDLFDVREVVEYTTITKIPNVPPYIRGIIDLRGEITTIVDLKSRLSIPENEKHAEETDRIIVLDDKATRTKTGILVDEVTSVSTFEASQVDYTSSAISQEDSAIIGIIKRKVKIRDKEKNELIIWIDIKEILDDMHGIHA